MSDRKIFLSRNYEETKFHPLLSEFIGMIAWESQCKSPRNFGGILAYFGENLKDAYGVDYFWIEDVQDKGCEKRFRTRTEEVDNETIFRARVQIQLDSIRNSVKAIGWLDEGHKLIRDYSGLKDKMEESFVKYGIVQDKNLTHQLTMHIFEEEAINGNKIRADNFFYYKHLSNWFDHLNFFYELSKQWLKSIEDAVNSAENYSVHIDDSASDMTRFLAVEGMKSLIKGREA